jgi:Tfp pilus assembly protein PilV
LATEAGDTMIEVIVAALLVALVAAAAFTGFASVADSSGTERHQSVAAQLAQTDEQRMSGLSVTQLSATAPAGSSNWALYGNETHTQTLDGTTFTITSTAKFISSSSSQQTCTTGGTSTADEIETASEVTWGTSNDGQPPVIEHSLLNPPAGGGLVVTVDGPAGASAPLQGATVNAVGPSPDTTEQSLTTDANGCAVFAGLDGGTYTLTTSESGYIAPPQAAASQSLILVAGTTQDATFALAQPGAVAASFDTVINNGAAQAIQFDTFSLANANLATTPISFGTTGTNAATVTSTQTLYPFASTTTGYQYSAYAGNCASDNAAGNDAAVTVAANATTPATIKLPAMLLTVKAGSTYVTSLSSYAVTIEDACGVYRSASSLTTITGSPDKFAFVAPYGSVDVCFAKSGKYSSQYPVTNTSMTGTAVTAITLPSTLPNTGSCP